MPEAKFAMEYGSIFVGAESGSMFPYDLTEGCRTLRQVEYAQPSGSSSDYVIGVDLATSTDRKADNAVSCYAYTVPACSFLCTAVIIRVAVALKAAWKSKFASTPAGPSTGVFASARYTSCSVKVRLRFASIA